MSLIPKVLFLISGDGTSVTNLHSAWCPLALDCKISSDDLDLKNQMIISID